jgi:integrase
MPADQHGQVDRLARSWRARWYDENGGRQAKAGFASKSAAREFLRGQVDEVAALRNGDAGALRRREMPMLDELADEYLAAHVAERNTKRNLTARLRKARAAFGEVRVDRLAVGELRAWRATLPERSAQAYLKALRQLLNYAVAVGLLDSNPASKIPNPAPKRREVSVFASLAEVEAVGAELPAEYRAIPVFAALTGLRPSEWIALERADLEGDVVRVRRVYTDGLLKPYGKQSGSLRTVPLPRAAAAALRELPPRLDTRLLFPNRRSAEHLDLPIWRRWCWDPALRAAGLEHRSPYALRHTYASLAIAAGVPLFELSRFMGTSAAMIDATYGHLLPDALDRTRSALDAFVNEVAEAAEGGTR